MFSSTGGGSRLVVAGLGLAKLCVFGVKSFGAALRASQFLPRRGLIFYQRLQLVWQCFLGQVSVLSELVNLLFSYVIVCVIVTIASSFSPGIVLVFFFICY